MADSIEAIQKSKRTYLLVFGALLIFTCATVAVATIPILDIGRHGFDMADCILGLLIASVKAGLVAMIFMHLNHEKQMIYWIFGLALITVVFLFGLTAMADGDMIGSGPIFQPFFYQD